MSGWLESDPAGAVPETGEHGPDPAWRVGEASRYAVAAWVKNMQVRRRLTNVDPGINLVSVGNGLALYAGHGSPPFVQTEPDGDRTKLRTALKRQGWVRPDRRAGRGGNPARAPHS